MTGSGSSFTMRREAETAGYSKLMGMGLQQDNDLELNFGKHIGLLID
jgi:hypothetical protein